VAPFIEELVVDEHRRNALDAAAQHVIAGLLVFMLVPVQDRAKLAATVAEFAAGAALALIDAKTASVGIVTNMAGLNDDEVLAVMRGGPMPVDGDLAADAAVVEGKRTKMLGHQNDGITLTFVRTERSRRHHPVALEPQGQTVIIQPRHEMAEPHRPVAKPQIFDDAPHAP
jgi:hypothetical protein